MLTLHPLFKMSLSTPRWSLFLSLSLKINQQLLTFDIHIELSNRNKSDRKIDLRKYRAPEYYRDWNEDIYLKNIAVLWAEIPKRLYMTNGREKGRGLNLRTRT